MFPLKNAPKTRKVGVRIFGAFKFFRYPTPTQDSIFYVSKYNIYFTKKQ